MPKKGSLTDRAVEALTPPATGKKIIWDNQQMGFGCAITPKGTRTFIYQYYFQRRKRRYTIGHFGPGMTAEDARKTANKLRSEFLDKDKDPLAEDDATNATDTVADLAKQYLERHAIPLKRASSLRNDKRMLASIIVPQLGTKAIAEVTREDIEALHHSLKATPYQANRVLSLIKTMFAKAMKWKLRLDNPATGIPRFHEEEREQWLREDQVRALEKALKAYPSQDAADVIRLLILTGSRSGEVLSARWQDIDLVRATWTKPSHSVKQNTTEHVPLNPAALSVLEKRAARKQPGEPYVFPGKKTDTTGHRIPGTQLRSFRRAWVQVCKAAGLAEPVQVQGRRKLLTRWRPTCRPHDLRHTFASHLVSRNVSLPIVGKLLGHRVPKTTARYAHISDKALRNASNTFAADPALWVGEKGRARAAKRS